ncbi:MAG TPA: hypothetical protein VFW40_00955, partial [Capsulimonadaceae bacterium]|nr:hypothetical protein [Capsulimonadaceae bacterium]
TIFRGSYRTLYYSIPSTAALPGTIGLSVKVGSSGTSAIATITPPAGVTPQCVELLHNAREVINFFNQGPYSVNVPPGTVTLSPGTTVADTHVHGYYVARVIDAQGRVGYSAPVYIP